jgi:hypothetical protein
MRACIIETVGKRTGSRVTLPVGKFGIQYAGSAGAEKQADAFATVTPASGSDSLGETILTQAKLGESIVAAVVSRKVVPHGFILQATYTTDISVQIHIEKVTLGQAGAA